MRSSVFRICLASVLAGGLAAPLHAQDSAAPGGGFSFEPYGHLNFAYQSFDDGRATEENLVDPATNTSRFGFFLRFASPLSFHFETGLGFRASNGVSQLDRPDFWDWDKTDLRKVQLIYEADFGTFKLGQGSMPLDGAAETDLGGYNVVAKSNIAEGYGSYIFREAGGALAGFDVGDVFDNFDAGRQFRLQYDTPSFNGFSLGLAYGTEALRSGNDDDFYDIALRYANSFGAFDVAGAIGPGWQETETRTERVAAGSFSVLHRGTGLNATLAAGRSYTAPDPSYIYGKLGWNTPFIPAGDTRLVAEFFDGEDYVTAGSDSNMWGFALLQDFDDLNLTLYAGYRAFEYSDPTPVSYLDAEGVQAGAVWKF